MKFAFPMMFSDPTHACAMARAAEENGWDAIACSDHMVYPRDLKSPYPYNEDGKPSFMPDTDWPDPWVLISAMAAVTTKLEFFTNIYILPLRNPFVVAKTLSTLSAISDGRVALGIGMGWMEEEFELCEQPFRRRGKRADEMIEVMRKLWTGEMVEHHGEFYDFDPVVMLPRPARPIRIWVGGVSAPAFRRVGQLGDGWISVVHSTEELREIIGKIRAQRERFGRADAPLDIVGSADDAFDLDGYRRLEDAGVTHLLTMPWLLYGGLITSLDDKIDGIKRFADDVIAKMG